MINIVTSICVDVDHEGENICYPMITKSNKRELYWRCVATFCFTSIRFNYDQRHLVFTNDTEEIIIRNLNIKNKLIKLGVEIIYLPFKKFDPKGYSNRFRNAFYKHEVMNALSHIEYPSLLLDADCIWTKRNEELYKQLNLRNQILLQDTYQRSHTPENPMPHNLSMKDMGELYKIIPLFKTKTHYPIWYGGELIGGSPDIFKQISKNIYNTIEYSKSIIDSRDKLTFNNGQSIFSNDEFISSYVYNSLSNIDILDTYGVFSKRMWTLKDTNNIKDSDIEITIWHLPAEKETGLKLLFDDLKNETSLFWQTKESLSIYLGNFFGIPKQRISVIKKTYRTIKKLMTIIVIKYSKHLKSMNKIKQVIKKVPMFGNLLVLIYKKFKKKSNARTSISEQFDTPSKWIDSLLTKKQAKIIQIGSNDGVTGDPLFDLIKKNWEWSAIFVEPVPYLFEKLKKNYNYENRFIFENIAINDGTSQIFYSVKKDAINNIPNLPSWYDQLGSFNKENILKHLDGILKPFITESMIEGVTLNQILTRNKITSFDLLHIDTEGYDWKILSQLDLELFTPIIILYEHKHLSIIEKQNSINFLKKHYSIFRLGQDFLCIKKDVINSESLVNLKGEFVI